MNSTTRTIHIASKEQYDQHENVVAAQVWEDFCLVNWLDLFDDSSTDQSIQLKLEQIHSSGQTTSDGEEIGQREDNESTYGTISTLANPLKKGQRLD